MKAGLHPSRAFLSATSCNIDGCDGYSKADRLAVRQQLKAYRGSEDGLLPAAPQKLTLPSPDAFGPKSDIDVILRAPEGHSQVASPLLSQQHRTVPFNDMQQVVEFETPLFKGRMQVLFKGMPNTPAGVFDGKRRMMWMGVQGQFKQPVPFDSLMLGSDFKRPLKLPASTLLTRASSWLMQRMGSGVQLHTSGDNPRIFAPLIAAAQVVNVSLPGQQPGLLDAEEDMTLYDATLVSSWSGKPLSASKRRSFFNSKTARQGGCFDTQHVWTFQVYDHVLDYSTFLLPIPLFKVDLIQVLDGQPMLLLLKDLSSGQSVAKFEVWHKRMLKHKANDSSSHATAAAVAAGSAAGVRADAEVVVEDGAAGLCNSQSGRFSSSGSWKVAAAGVVVA